MAAKHQEDQAAMKEQILDIPTKDGAIETFVCHPERGGPYPPVLFLMDAPGIREELYDMARRLATVGYYVLLPNLYYRAGKDTKYGADVLEKGSAEQARMRAVRTKMTIPPVMDDVAALIAFADSQKESKKGPVGTHGYCMSGPYSLAAAARYPDRIAAAASFYGTWLVSDAVESPHLTLGKAKGELYISCATIVEHEDAFIDLAFEQGGIEGMTAQDVKRYTRFIADRRLAQLSLQPIYKQDAKNPLPWMDQMLNAIEHTNFFENRATEYSKASTKGTWEEAFS